MSKMIVFDMDGTIADLYGYPDWLALLRRSDATPYLNAEPLYDMAEMRAVLNAFKELGFRIAITSWLSKESDKAFDKATRDAKREWLKKFDFPFDECHLVKYGTRKSKCTRGRADYQILVDDNAEVRLSWNLGATIDAKNENVLAVLQAMLKEVETA